MVVVDAHESQGYALQEAMSCGVPLLVWDVQSMYQEFNGNRQVYQDNGYQLLATSVPYWDERCGIRVENKEDLTAALDRMQESWGSFRPREFVVETLSDIVCMRRWLDYFNIEHTCT
jgi:glycosyltransferase involved in cell wall biosynthesis